MNWLIKCESESGFMKTELISLLKRLPVFTLGSLIYAAGIALFLDPNHLAPGGVSGIAIILASFLPLATGTLTFLINLPLMILGVWKLGLRTMVNTITVIVIMSALTNLLAPYGPSVTDPLLAALVGGGLLGLGIGLIFRHGGTTGGTDIIVSILRRKYKHIKTNTLFLILDVVVVAASALAFGDLVVALYAGIAVTATSVVLDKVLYGSDEARLVYIISDKQERISGRLLADVDAGVTLLEGRGAYTGNEKKVILCAVQKRVLPLVQQIAREEDSECFLIVTSATEIYGEGFKSHTAETL